MKHLHKSFEIITQYYENRPNIVVSAKCSDCREFNWKVRKIMQDRENISFEMRPQELKTDIVEVTKLKSKKERREK